MNYEELHRQCRTLENLFDSKLISYSRIISAISLPSNDVEAGGSSERWKDMEAELDDLFEKLEETNDQLANLSSVPDRLSPSMLRAIQRHRELFQDSERELKRTKTSVKTALERASLLTGVRNDIDAYKSSAADSLLAERERLDNSHRLTDDILNQAYETRTEFGRQHVSLTGINKRMQGVINTIPGINNVLSMIKSRRRRDSIILGSLIGFCTVIILTYMWR